MLHLKKQQKDDEIDLFWMGKTDSISNESQYTTALVRNCNLSGALY